MSVLGNRVLRREDPAFLTTGGTYVADIAIENATQICNEHLAGSYDLDVIDIFQQPTLAKDDQILAVPTLIKKLPLPLRKFIGDLSNQDVVLIGLDLKPAKKP